MKCLLCASLLAATGCPSSPSPSGTAKPASTPAPCPSATAPPDDSLENPWCAPVDNAAYGDWKPSPEEVLSAIKALKHGGVWLVGMVEDCMQRIGHPYVTVMRGVMTGDRGTPNAIVIGIGSALWNGRRFITVENDARMGGGFVSTMDAVELTARGPVQVIETCQEDPLSRSGPSGKRVPPPSGWGTFPEEVRRRLCP